jgi:hypothetical protein
MFIPDSGSEFFPSRILLAPLAPSLISQFVKLQAERCTFHAKVLLTSVVDPGCLSRIPGPNFFRPGSTSKNLSILTQKIDSKLSEI